MTYIHKWKYWIINNFHAINNQILNLARFISIIKYKQIDWKANHPFILIDRFEDEQSGQKNDEEDCSLSFYGYVRGASLRDNKRVFFYKILYINN